MIRDWRFWVWVLIAVVGIVIHDYADDAWWGSAGTFAVGFAIASAYYLGKRS